jgi:hypothetical protein
MSELFLLRNHAEQHSATINYDPAGLADSLAGQIGQGRNMLLVLFA